MEASVTGLVCHRRPCPHVPFLELCVRLCRKGNFDHPRFWIPFSLSLVFDVFDCFPQCDLSGCALDCHVGDNFIEKLQGIEWVNLTEAKSLTHNSRHLLNLSVAQLSVCADSGKGSVHGSPLPKRSSSACC